MSSPSSNVTSQSGVPVAPAPWRLRGRWWIFFTSPLSKGSSFPAGWSVEWQAEALARDDFVGGLGGFLVVRYDESPVGPYDELIYVPGRFRLKDGSTGFRITRIYVSTKDSTENGRRNWNIPKQVAKFEYQQDPSSPQSWSLQVFPLDSTTPFFSVNVRPIPVITSIIGIPINSKILPGNLFGLNQPPVPKGPLPEEVEAGRETIEKPDLDDKAKHAKVTPNMKGSIFFVKASPGFENGTVGDGKMFPAVSPWTSVAAVEGFDLTFPVTEWIEQ